MLIWHRSFAELGDARPGRGHAGNGSNASGNSGGTASATGGQNASLRNTGNLGTGIAWFHPAPGDTRKENIRVRAKSQRAGKTSSSRRLKPAKSNYRLLSGDPDTKEMLGYRIRGKNFDAYHCSMVVREKDSLGVA